MIWVHFNTQPHDSGGVLWSITARYRFIKNAYWVLTCAQFISSTQHCGDDSFVAETFFLHLKIMLQRHRCGEGGGGAEIPFSHGMHRLIWIFAGRTRPMVRFENVVAILFSCRSISGSGSGTNVCPGGWYQFRNNCFLYVNTKLNWDEAMSHCETMGELYFKGSLYYMYV